MFPKKGKTKKRKTDNVFKTKTKKVPSPLKALLKQPQNHPDIKLPGHIIVKWGEESDEWEYALSKDGYLMVKYGEGKKNSALVHRLVAEQYLPNKQCKQIVHHKDCNKRNNMVENLMWVTPYEHAQFHEHLRF